MNVVLYGASGWTGALTADAVERSGMKLVLAGRNEAKLSELSARMRTRPEVRVASMDDPRALERSLRGADVVVNCAGPYLDLGHGVVEAALAAGCHYFDASGEHSFVRSVYERYHDAARQRRVTLCPAFAAKGALGDWGAKLLAEEGRREPVHEVAIAYAHGLREYLQPSAGSVLAIAGQGFFKPRDDHDPTRSVARTFTFPAPFGPGLALLVPGAEDVSLPRHMAVRAVRTFLSLAPGSLVNGPWARTCIDQLPWMPIIADALRANPEALRLALREPRQETGEETFMVVVEVATSRSVARLAMASTDAYAITAKILAHGLRELGRPNVPRGVVPPSILADGRTALRSLVKLQALRVLRSSERRAA